MRTGWELRSIDELAKVGRGRSRHRPRNDPSLYGGEYPFIQTADIHASDLYITSYSQTYSEAGLRQSQLWEPGVICITNAGENTGDCAILGIRACFPDSILTVEPIESVADPVFLKYSIDLLKPQLRRVTRGATQDNLSAAKLLAFKFPAPAFPVQRRIGDVLRGYGDLIENNRRRIALLEESARLLYREWFVRLRFPGHEHTRIVDGVPEGWQLMPLFEIAEATYGYPFQSSLFNEEDEGLPVVRIRDILAGETKTFTPEEAPPDKLLEDGDFLIGMDGDFHMGIWAGGKAYLNQRVVRFRSRGLLDDYLLFWSLVEPIRHFNATITGTTVVHLGAKELRTIRLLIPERTIRHQANEWFSPVRKQVLALKLLNKKLKLARDLLLPRLMRGEIAV